MALISVEDKDQDPLQATFELLHGVSCTAIIFCTSCPNLGSYCALNQIYAEKAKLQFGALDFRICCAAHPAPQEDPKTVVASSW